MITFIIVGGVGLVLILLSLVLGEFIDFGGGVISGTVLGTGAVFFGATGALVMVNTWPIWIAYVGALAVAALAVFLIQALIKHLQDTEDGVPESLIGVHGIATADINPTRGEVSLESAQELESRLAWSEEPIPAGAHVTVLEQSAGRVRVQQYFPND